MAKKKKQAAPIEYTTVSLTDEDLAPARKKAMAHAQAVAKAQHAAVEKEIALKERGEVSELTVPQVVPFNLSAAFQQIALEKAKWLGFDSIQNLRKTPDGWIFEAFNAPTPTDQL